MVEFIDQKDAILPVPLYAWLGQRMRQNVERRCPRRLGRGNNGERPKSPPVLPKMYFGVAVPVTSNSALS